jgi:hypothetical protein
MINPTEEDIAARRQAMNGPLEEIAGYIPEAFPQGSEEPVEVGCYYCDQPVDAEKAEHWVNDSYPCCEDCFDASFDKLIEKILSDNTPVEPNSTDVLIAKLGITQGQNRMMADALEKSLHIMRSYRRLGYGDDVYMSTLCDAICHAERAIDYFKVDLPANPRTLSNTTLDEQERAPRTGDAA